MTSSQPQPMTTSGNKIYRYNSYLMTESKLLINIIIHTTSSESLYNTLILRALLGKLIYIAIDSTGICNVSIPSHSNHC